MDTGDLSPLEPIRQIMVKLCSRCNLACTYCYIYHSVDRSWIDQPVYMSREVIDLAARRFGEHARRHHPPYVTVIFHGGEPLLAGAETIAYAARAMRAAVSPHTRVNLHIQTNATLLDESFLDLFDTYQILVGVSLDGDRAAHDRCRVTPDGRGSFELVARGLRLLGSPRYRHLYSGILCTVNIENDPVLTYQGIVDFQPRFMDFLLPHGHWMEPPPRRSPDSSDTPYADWLIPIFDQWYATAPQHVGIRLFESIVDLILGGPTRSEAVGIGPGGLAVIECDGSIEQTDVLKTTAVGGAATGLHLSSATLDDVNALPLFRDRHAGLAGLASSCQRCESVRICGGGLYAHRFRAENGFDNPSVYCPDLKAFIGHVRDRVHADLARLGMPIPDLASVQDPGHAR